MPVRPPESAHHLVLAGQRVEFALRRSSRRSIGLSIDHRGLRVGAPLRAPLRDIEALIRQHGTWVLDKLANWRDKPAPERFQVIDGGSLPLLGKALQLQVTTAGRSHCAFSDQHINISVAPAADVARILEQGLRHQARAVFAERLAVHAPRLGVSAPPLRLSSARTRWGSCSARGNISLNWRLIFMPLPIVDYVVCHELAHLREMNHSPRFWSVVEQLCPDWQALRIELRRLGRQLPQF